MMAESATCPTCGKFTDLSRHACPYPDNHPRREVDRG